MIAMVIRTPRKNNQADPGCGIHYEEGYAIIFCKWLTQGSGKNIEYLYSGLKHCTHLNAEKMNLNKVYILRTSHSGGLTNN